MAASMLASLAENVRQRRADAWIFEVGKTYWMDAGKGPRWAYSAGTGRFEAWHLGIALLGPAYSRWSEAYHRMPPQSTMHHDG